MWHSQNGAFDLHDVDVFDLELAPGNLGLLTSKLTSRPRNPIRPFFSYLGTCELTINVNQVVSFDI